MLFMLGSERYNYFTQINAEVPRLIWEPHHQSHMSTSVALESHHFLGNA